MRYLVLLVAIVALPLGSRPAAAQWSGAGVMWCGGVPHCCARLPVVVKRSATQQFYRKGHRSGRSVVRYDRLDGFIPEIATRRAACCGY